MRTDGRGQVEMAEEELRTIIKCVRGTEACLNVPVEERESLVCSLIARFNRSLKAA